MGNRNWMLALLLTLTLALAGCNGDDGDETTDTTETETGTETDTETATQTGDPPSEEPVVETCETTASAGVALNARGICTFADMGLDASLYRSGLIEMTWDSLQPGILDVMMALESDSCSTGVGGNDCSIKETNGMEAPLTVSITSSDLEQYAGDGLKVLAEVSGAAADQPFTIYVSLFELETVPDGYTAV